MKILLVKPYNSGDHIQPSLGLGYLASSLRRSHHDVKILDCVKEKITINRFRNVIAKEKPDIMGFQLYTSDLGFVKKALNISKEVNKDIVTVVGGHHPSAMPVETLEAIKDDLDFLFVGEAELSLPKLLDKLAKGDKRFDDVPGLAWREKGQIRLNDKFIIEDLDSLPMPAWDLIRPETYPESQHGAFFKKFPIAPIILTRGCPYSCTFCAGNLVSGKRIRKRNIDNVLDEIRLLHNDYGIREFHIIDDNFTQDISYAKNFLRRLKALNLDISWAAPNGVRMDTLDEEILKLMKETGLYLISLGIESGSDEVLRRMKKGTDIAKIRRCVKMIKANGIDMAGFFILGFPGDTEKSIKDTIRFSIELGIIRANFMTYLPFPGSESYRELSAGKELEGVDWENFYFKDASYAPKGITRKRLKNLQRLAFARFYLRPRIILYNIKSVQSLRHLGFLSKRFVSWIVKG
ncbi:MAG: radical SAM protein [Candidatus Omnitrophica bacterium]|nr:radical SAM protein [Candidatus Omnitrophota bacterium]